MASRCWRSRAIGLAFAACLAAPHGAFGAQDTAKRYFQNGVDLITAAQPNYQDAYYQFQLAYRESGQSWKVLGNLGLCALKLERDQEAVGFYEQYLKKGGSEIAAEERAAIEQDLLLLKGNLATVRISSPVQELKIVDRRAGSSAPAQSYSLKGGALELELRDRFALRANPRNVSGMHRHDREDQREQRPGELARILEAAARARRICGCCDHETLDRW